VHWADQSPNGNDARAACSLSPGYAPVLLPGDLAGHDTLKFGTPSRITATIKDAATLQFGTGPFALVAVLSAPTGTSGTDYFYKAGSTPGDSFQASIDSNANLTTPTAAAHAYFPATGYHVVVVRGPALEIRVDGTAVKGTTSTTDISYPLSDVVIGVQVSDESTMKEIDLAELIAVKGAMTDGQVTGIESYLKARYKLSF
jgi:hypothetical protein